MLAAWNRQRDDLGGFGQIANLFEPLVIRRSLGIDFDVETADIEAVRVADQTQHLIELFDDAFRRNLIGSVVEFDLDGGEFKIPQSLESIRKRQLRKTPSGSGDVHS